MKKLLKVLLCLILVFSLVPRSEAKAEEGKVTNITIDANGIMTWDEYPGTMDYVVDWGGEYGVGTRYTMYDLTALFSSEGLPSGDYTIMIFCVSDDYSTIATSDPIPFHYESKGKCPAPTNIRWNERDAMWDNPSVAGSSPANYSIQIYKNGQFSYSLSSWGQPGLELEEYLIGENVEYSFTVKIQISGYEWSDESVRSTAVKGDPQLILRLAGKSRYMTSRMVADQVLTKRQEWGGDKFWSVVITTGENYPDALSGSFLANRFGAPMLMINEKSAPDIVQYVKNNLNEYGTIYILGGTGAVPDEWLGDLLSSDYEVKRLAGANRYKTNLEILKEVNVTNSSFLVCTGQGFADSLSCSSLTYPILLVGKSLNAEQREFLNSVAGEYTGFYIIGGEGAVSAEIESELANYGWTYRIKGKNRYETSVAIAEFFRWNSTNVVLATGKNFPDGLSGGPLASSYGAPLILVDDGKTSYAETFSSRYGVKNGFALGGTAAVSEDTMNKVFHIGE